MSCNTVMHTIICSLSLSLSLSTHCRPIPTVLGLLKHTLCILLYSLPTLSLYSFSIPSLLSLYLFLECLGGHEQRSLISGVTSGEASNMHKGGALLAHSLGEETVK